MAKRLSLEEKNLIVKCFTEGKTIDELADQFLCTKSTIVRNLKRNIEEKKYQELVNSSKNINNLDQSKEKNKSIKNKMDVGKKNQAEFSKTEYLEEEFIPITQFTELTPLNDETFIQKDFSSINISNAGLPQIVYMIVDKKIELEIKYLKEYPDWQFLSEEELNRKTIEIFIDLKIAKRFCNKDQKVITVPNTDVFRIVAPLLLNKGISRIVSSNKLFAL